MLFMQKEWLDNIKQTLPCDWRIDLKEILDHSLQYLKGGHKEDTLPFKSIQDELA